MISASVTSRSGPFSRATNCTCIALLLAIASSSAPSWNGRGAFGLAVPGVLRKRLPSTSPRLAETPGGRRRDSGTTAEGPPHVRRDDGAEATSRRCQPKRSGGNPEGAGAPAQRLGPLRSLDNRSLEGAAARPDCLPAPCDWQTQGGAEVLHRTLHVPPPE